MANTNYNLGPVTRGLPSGVGTSTTAQPSGWQRANNFLSSPTGQLAVGGLASGLGAYAQGKANDRTVAAEQQMQEDRLAQERESMLAKLAVEQSQNATARAMGAARPIGEAQQFAGSMARNNAILDLLGAGPMTPGNSAIAQAANLGSLPRVSADALSRMRNTYSEPATLQSLLTRDQDIAAINPQSAPTNYASLAQGGESPLTKALLSQFQTYRTGAQDQLEDSESYARRILQQAIDGTSGPVGTSKGTGGSPTASPFPEASAGSVKSGAAGEAKTLTGSAGAIGAQLTPSQRFGGVDAPTYFESLVSTPPVNGKPQNEYDGGRHAPRANQLTSTMQANIRGRSGVGNMEQKHADELVKQGWMYGMPAPEGFEYDDKGLISRKGSIWKTLGKVGIIAGAAAIAIGSGGTLTPVSAAMLGAGSGAALGAIDGGWKGALTGAALGGVTGGVGGAIAQSGLNTAQQIGANAAMGAGTGALQGGTRGALLGAAGGGGSSAIGPATSNLTPGATQSLAQAGLSTGLNRALGGDWTNSAISGGLAYSQAQANQQRQNQYRQQQQAKLNQSPLARAIHG